MYSLISCRRQPDQLVIELKRNFRQEMLFPLIIVSVFLFLVFSVIFGPLAFFLLCFGMFWFYCFFRNRVILRYDAATLHVIYRRDLVFAQWHKQRIYNRADVPPPVTWIHAISPNFRSFRLIDNSLSWEFHYETRFPFLLRKTRGVICMHPGKEKMLALQKAVDDFLAEVPYDKTLFDRTEASLSSQNVTRNTIVKPQEREQKRDATRFDSAKRYAFDRGETPIRRGDESVAKGEPAAKKKRTRNKSYALRRCSMVKIEEEVSADLTQGTLKLVSTSGGVFSAGMAVLSILLFYAGLLTLVIGGSVYLAMQIYRWEQIERCFERYLAPHLEQSVFPRLPEEMREPVVDAMQWYFGASQGGEQKFGAVTITIVIWLVLLLMSIMFSRMVRWPFWRRWTVEMKNILPHHRCEALFSWRNDRNHTRESAKKFNFFFRVIPATRKTNRLLTGRPRFAKNPGWKQPYQVVLITAEGSFPLPCGDPVEQEEIMDRFIQFAREMLPQR
ncbi:MAG: hypothetical protein FWH27_02885 [Planctomycetaceae bacterium]|nr:hypothetical protein [Planctomycetaceae bacterium]